jgi:lysophospholipase L1-like esterase
MMKKLLLVSLVPMTLSLQAVFVMKKGQPLKKVDQNTENLSTHNSPTSDTENTVTTMQNENYLLNSDTDDNNIQLRLPNTIKVLQGDTLDIYLNNIVNVQNMNSVKFSFYLNGKQQSSFKGLQGKNRFISLKTSPGISKLKVTITLNGKIVASANSQITTFSKSISTKPVRILTIGDSFTDGSDILKPLKSFLDANKHSVSFIGTEQDSGIKHEGRGGWSAAGYMNLNPKWYPNSPFLNANKIDFKNYFNNKLKNKPDIVIIQLGVNDLIRVTKDIAEGFYNIDPSTQVKNKVKDLTLLVNTVKNSLNTTKILVLLPTPPNRTLKGKQSGLAVDKYKDFLQEYYKYSLSALENRESEGIYVVPAYLSIDPWNEFSDFVHPTLQGYSKIAKSLMGEILWISSKK